MKKSLFTIAAILIATLYLKAQNDVMMQAFYWDLPADKTNKNGYWWDTLRIKNLSELRTAGVTALWLPSPCKGSWGIEDMGYGIYDHYDLGAYNQKGSVETHFGSKAELLSLIADCHNTGKGPRVDVYADAVLNHTYGSWEDNEESNPGVKAYIFGEAQGGTKVAYQTSDVKWVIPNAAPGDYYIQIKGYNLPWSSGVTERGYNVNINWTSATETDPGNWESEPNNGGGQFNIYPNSGITVRGHITDGNDIDEYKITLTTTKNIVIKITAMKETSNPWAWVWADQTNGYYPKAVWFNGSNLANTTLEARTPTKSTFPTHTGTGEANFQWGFADYHPVNGSDWMGGGGFEDELVPNTRWFGNDFNTYSTTVQSRLNVWGQWMINTIGFDGYRLDFVRGFQVDFISNWINNLPKNGTQQRYIVGEYWTSHPYRLKNWINDNAAKGATVSVFDFPLKQTLKDMCNGNGSSFDMRWLNHAGMVRNIGNNVSGVSVSTFLDNHDTGKEHDKWVSKDWKLGYAYILTHEGRPCLFYPHFYGVKQVDSHNSSYYTQASANLKDDIKKLMFVRKTYLGGTLTVLTEIGNPYPSADAYNVYVARRGGNGTKSGAIVVLNNNDSQVKGVWVDVSPSGWTSWAGKYLVNAFNPTEKVQVYADGRAYFSAPARGYAVYVLETEYVAYSAKSLNGVTVNTLQNQTEKEQIKGIHIYPNPATDILNISVENQFENSEISVFNMMGSIILQNNKLNGTEGTLNISSLPQGVYYIMVRNGNNTKKLSFIKQ